MPSPRGFLRSCVVAFVVGVGRGREVSGAVPTAAPPSSVAPTFDRETAILYDFTGLTLPYVMRISKCYTYGMPFENICELRSGYYSYWVFGGMTGDFPDAYYGVSKCGEGKTCILACSQACSCAITGDFNLEEVIDNCTVVAPTDRPTPSPSTTIAPTESPPSSAVAKALGLAAGVAFGGFLVLGTA